MLLIRPQADIPITHNLRGVRDLNHPIVDWAAAFQDWTDDTFTSKSTLTYEQRAEQAVEWHTAPGATLAHPTRGHFIPFVVAAGAGMDEEKPGAERFFGGLGAGHLTFAYYAWGLQE